MYDTFFGQIFTFYYAVFDLDACKMCDPSFSFEVYWPINFVIEMFVKMINI